MSLILRRPGSYYTPLDGWGVDVFELVMGAICVARYFEKSWRSSSSRATSVPPGAGGGHALVGRGGRRHNHRVARWCVAAHSFGRGRLLSRRLSPLLRRLHPGHPARQQPVAGRHVARRVDRRARRGVDLRRVRIQFDPEDRRGRGPGDGHEHGLSDRRSPSSVPGHRRPRHPSQGVQALSRHRQLCSGGPRRRGRLQPPAARQQDRLHRRCGGVADLAV